MTCEEYQEKLMDAARSAGANDAAAWEHLRACEQCEREWLNQRSLSAGLKAMASTESAMPSAALEQELLSRFPTPRNPSARVVRWLVPGLAAAAMVLLAWLFLPRAEIPVRIPVEAPPSISAKVIEPAKEVSVAASKLPRRTPHRARKVAAAKESEQPFIPIPYAEPMLPTEQAEIVRVDLPASALASLGMPVQGADPAMRLHAELLLGENGLARAIRLVSWDAR